MVISIVTRKTSVKDRAQYLWSAQDDGQMGQVTRWQTLEDCLRYVRGGGAATVALHEDRAIPTASYPHGAWLRRTFEVVDAG